MLQQVYAVLVDVGKVIGNEVLVDFFPQVVNAPVGAIDVHLRRSKGLCLQIPVLHQTSHESIAELAFSKIAATVAEHQKGKFVGCAFSKNRIIKVGSSVARPGNQCHGFLRK